MVRVAAAHEGGARVDVKSQVPLGHGLVTVRARARVTVRVVGLGFG